VNALSSGVHETFTWPWQRHPAPPDPHVRRWRRGPEGRHGRRGRVGSLTAPPTRSSADRATARRTRPPARVVWRGRSITTESRPGSGSPGSGKAGKMRRPLPRPGSGSLHVTPSGPPGRRSAGRATSGPVWAVRVLSTGNTNGRMSATCRPPCRRAARPHPRGVPFRAVRLRRRRSARLSGSCSSGLQSCHVPSLAGKRFLGPGSAAVPQ
jgi:hypothetical protein